LAEAARLAARRAQVVRAATWRRRVTSRSPGTYKLRCVAFDGAGNSQTSAPRTIKIVN
jgi:hypothetical protein